MTVPPLANAGEPPGGGRLAGFKQGLRDGAQAALEPAAAWLARLGVRPDHLTALGLLLSAIAGLAFFDGHSRLAALLLALGGLCDLLDGQVARLGGGETRFGALMDSTLDRLGESLVLLGILGFYLRNLAALAMDPAQLVTQMAIGLHPGTWAVVALTAVLALVGSFMVSYVRARAEGLGLDCRVGWFERPERLALLIVAGALQVFWAMSAALLLLAILSFATAYQRVAHVWKLTRPR